MASVWVNQHLATGETMARSKSDATVDLSKTHELSEGLIKRLQCPPGLPKALLRDKDVTGLKVRVTANGAKSFIYEARLNGKAISKTLGGFPLMSIEEAKAEARQLAKVVKNDRIDPRELLREQAAEKAAQVQAAEVAGVTVAEVWAVYLAERKPHWGDRHYADHIAKAAPAGVPVKRGKGVTTAGPLFPLLALPLRDLDAPTVEAWAAEEGKTRPTSARLAWRLLKGFLGWCSEQPAYADLLPSKNPAKTKKSREALGKAGVKADVLQREQLAVWFGAVRKIGNQTISAYLQTVLLTGARPGEVMSLQWTDLNTQWKGISIRDKVAIDGKREIPLTPYVAHLLAALPRRVIVDKKTGAKTANPWVFSSPTAEAGHLSEPTYPHTVACRVAGLDGLSLHGLRRSFKSLTEWLEVPVGVVAQVMGHKPSATAEKHYTVRPLELLRVHHERIEAWILEQAGVKFDATASPGALQVVASA
jgi:integrase